MKISMTAKQWDEGPEFYLVDTSEVGEVIRGSLGPYPNRDEAEADGYRRGFKRFKTFRLAAHPFAQNPCSHEVEINVEPGP